MPFLSVLPLVGHMLFAETPVPFSAMRYQTPRWWRKQRGLGPNQSKQWVNLSETDMAMIEAAAIKRVERRHRRLREMGRSP